MSTAPRSARKLLCALLAVAAALTAMLAPARPARGDYLTVYGGPTYDATTKTGFDCYANFPSGTKEIAQDVNDFGAAVGCSIKLVNGANQGLRPFRWGPDGVTELGNLGSASDWQSQVAVVYAINNAGAAVGYSKTYYVGGRGQAAVRWDAGQSMPTELGNLGIDPSGYKDSTAFAINEAGTVVGRSNKYADGTWLGGHGVRWDSGQTAPTELGNLGPNRVYATVINDAGTIAGLGDPTKPPVRWDAGQTAATELGALWHYPAYQNAYSVPRDINNSGTIVGYAQYDPGDGRPYISHPVRWDAGQTAITELGYLGTDSSGFTTAQAHAVNDAGTAVGFCWKYVGGIYKGCSAVRWDAGETAAHELPVLGTPPSGAIASSAYAISEDGEIAGGAATYVGETGYSRAVIWTTDGQIVDLNTLIDPASGWTLEVAMEISPNGHWVAGEGYYDPDGAGPLQPYGRLWVMQIPEPCALAMLAAGALLLRRRK